MDIVIGEGFSERFKKGESSLKSMWVGTSVEPKSIGISWNTIIEHIKKEVKIPKSRYPGWELTTGNIGRYVPDFNLRGVDPIPDIREFNKDYELTFPKSVWNSEPFREIQNIYLKACVEYCSSPPELIDYFCGMDWDEFQLDLRTFLIPQGIKTTEELQVEYPKYYEIFRSSGWLC
jgi:hypothetical protein